MSIRASEFQNIEFGVFGTVTVTDAEALDLGIHTYVAKAETTEPYIPAKVAPLEREKAGLERMLEQNTQEGKEIRAKLEQVQNKIAETMGSSES